MYEIILEMQKYFLISMFNPARSRLAARYQKQKH